MYGPKLSAVDLGCILCYTWIRILQGENIGHFGFYSVFGRLGLGLNCRLGLRTADLIWSYFHISIA